MTSATHTVGILLFDHVDLLDVGGPYEVFLTASRLAARDGVQEPFRITTIGCHQTPVSAYGGLQLIAHRTAREVDDLDVLIVPGAINIDEVRANSGVYEALHGLLANSALVASVCTGAFLLADHGLLEARSWTTHWEDIDQLAAVTHHPPALGTPAWVDAGPVVTAGGLSAGIAMALHLVDRLCGPELARRTARQIDYVWPPRTSSDGHA